MPDPLLLDGALATELSRRGFELEAPLFAARALFDAPELIVEIHRDYALAGAQVLSTNSFGLHQQTLAAAGLGQRQAALARRAVELTAHARQLVRASDPSRASFRVAASVPPAPASPASPRDPDLDPELELELDSAELLSLASALVDAGADLVLFETFSELPMIRAALRAATQLEVPVWLSVVGDARAPHRGRLLGGASFEELAALCMETPLRRPDALLLNCTQIDAVPQALDAMIAATAGQAHGSGELPWHLGLYPHLGRARQDGEWIERFIDADIYAEQIQAWMQARPPLSLAGACCGSTPDYVSALQRRLQPDEASRIRAAARLAAQLP